MKQLILIFILVFTVCSFADFANFSENPAEIGGREFGHIVIPGFAMDGGFRNSLLNFTDFSMFEKGHILSAGEKETLTAEDLSFSGFGKFTLLQFGYKNWDFSINSHINGSMGKISKNYLNLVFYGNSSDSYYESALSDTRLYQFTKAKFSWTNPGGLNLSFIPIFDFAGKNSSDFVYHFQDALNYFREMNLYLGFNLNMYNTNGYGEVINSEQQFITSPEMAYYKIDASYIYSDTGEINSGFALGFGLGCKLQLPAGWIHLGIDDIAAKLEYDNLMIDSYTKEFTDYLDLLNDDHEAIEEEIDPEETEYEGTREVEINPTIVFGVEHELGRGFSAMAKVLSCDYMLDGLFLGLDYRLTNWMPLSVSMSRGDVNSYRFGWAIDINEFEMSLGLTGYDGMFNASKGIGADYGIRFKF